MEEEGGGGWRAAGHGAACLRVLLRKALSSGSVAVLQLRL